MTTESEIKEMFEAWIKWYMRDGPDDYLFCDEDMEAAYRQGQSDLIDSMNGRILYSNLIDDGLPVFILPEGFKYEKID